jgi:hypothetical protein
MAKHLSGSGPQVRTGSIGIHQPEVSEPSLPVLVDGSGRRRRRVRVAAAGVGTACTAYVCVLVVSLTAVHVNPFGLPDIGGSHGQIQPLGDGPGSRPDGTSVGERDTTALGTMPILLTLSGFAPQTSAQTATANPSGGAGGACAAGSTPEAGVGVGVGTGSGVSAGADVNVGTGAGG